MNHVRKSLYMKSNFYTRLIGAVIVAGLLAACSAASPDNEKQARLDKLKKEQIELAKEITKLEAEIAKENPDAAKNVKAKEVTVTEISPKKFDHFVQTQGTIESENNILVSPKAGGTVTQIFVTEGQQVSKGQVLAQLDNSVIARNIESMESQLELATAVFERQQNLWKQTIGTEVQYLQAKTNKESLEKQLASYREQNDMFRIKAPIAGTVDEILINVGESASPMLGAFRVVNGSDLKITARVSEAYVTNIKKGNKVLVSTSELKKEIVATVTFVGKNINPLSRTFNVEINLPSNESLRPNMTGVVKIIFDSNPSALVVPVNVIQSLNNEKVVYVAEANGKETLARKKVVTIDGVFANQAQVDGLKAGDKIITTGYQGLNDGDPIKI
jgi:membrane fusion protein (multidrug efflux system)